jgi:large subunit ribosomal protein L31
MKPDLHPVYKNSTITCACGASYETRSTRGSYNVDVCSACHPFFTGKARIMDKEGRVEKFRSRYKTAADKNAEKKKK